MRAFRKVVLADAILVELREWSRMANDLTSDKNRVANRLREQLWRYYPQMLELEADITAEWMLDLWEALPTPAKAARVRELTVKKILKDHRIRRIDAAASSRHSEEAHDRRCARNDRGRDGAHSHADCTPATPHRAAQRRPSAAADLVCAPCRAGRKTDEEAKSGQINEQRDAAILASMPGNGRIVLATLLAEAWDALQRRDYHALRALCGVAPITKRSGKSRIVIRRLACHPRLRNAVYHWANAAIQYDDKCRAKYDALRARAHSHARALRSVADRLLAVACAMLKNGTLFDPSLAHAH
jgi:transposase